MGADQKKSSGTLDPSSVPEISTKQAASLNVVGVNSKPVKPPADGQWGKGTAQKFEDGDTVTVQREDGSLVNCRVKDIDADETSKPWKNQPAQPYAEKAVNTLKSLLGNKEFDLRVETDRESFTRKICSFAREGKSVNLEMVKLGAAWASHFNGGNPAFIEAETLAKAKKQGLWINDNPERPDKYRKRYPDK